MNTNALNKQYEHLSPVERIRLTVKAKAREDQQEIDLLRRSCPRLSYTGMDQRYARRWEAFDDIFFACISSLLTTAAEIARLESWAEILDRVKPIIYESAQDVWFDAVYEVQCRPAPKKTIRTEGMWNHEKFSKKLQNFRETIDQIIPASFLRMQADTLSHRDALTWQALDELFQRELCISAQEVLDAFAEPDMRDSVRSVLARAAKLPLEDPKRFPLDWKETIAASLQLAWTNLTRGL